MSYVIGIDVGTTSVRGALVTETGTVEKVLVQQITTWNPREQFYQQSTDEIWSRCCAIIKELICDIQRDSIKGVGFDATSSLAVINAEGGPVSVNVGDENTQNVVLWMDHRAEQETKLINKTKHPLLRNTGGTISVESMLPKLLWLRKNHPECWKSAEYFFLLPDFLTWKATGQDSRSLGCVVGKCNYESSPNVSQWNDEFYEVIGLGELRNENWKKIGSKIIDPGTLCGKLTTKAATESGLLPGTPVGASLIDSHAGVIGTMGCVAEDVSSDFTTRITMISGTSTCDMTFTKKEIYAAGVWGPFYGAILPSLWLLSGGQSAAGKLIDHVIDSHPARDSIIKKSGNLHVTQYLNRLLNEMATQRGLTAVDELTKNLHVWPDFHGNRTPLGDSSIRGMILGLSLDNSEENLAILYLATIQSLAYSTKLIIDTIKEAGHDTMESLIICGGLTKNELFMKAHANALNVKVLLPEEKETVLLGVSVIAASAAGIYPSLSEAMLKMGGSATVIPPDPNVRKYHEKKYQVSLKMLNHQIECKTIMEK